MLIKEYVYLVRTFLNWISKLVSNVYNEIITKIPLERVGLIWNTNIGHILGQKLVTNRLANNGSLSVCILAMRFANKNKNLIQLYVSEEQTLD